MTGRYQIDAYTGLIMLWLDGPARAAASRELLDAARRDPTYRPGMRVLIDRRGLSELPGDAYTEEMLAILSSGWRAEEIAAWAVVARPGAPFGLARMLELKASLAGVPIGSFPDEVQAIEWLLGTAEVP